MQAGKLQLAAVHQRDGAPVYTVVEIALLIHPAAVFDRMAAGEPAQRPADVACVCGRPLAVGRENGAGKSVLMQYDIALGRDIFGHIAVDVEMVRGDIGYHRHIG